MVKWLSRAKSASAGFNCWGPSPKASRTTFLSRRTKYIERMGTGIQDMLEHCKNTGLQPPEFKLDDAFVITIWWKKGIAFENIGGQISDTQQMILLLLYENNKISRKAVAEKLKINESAIQKHINTLKRLGIIERIGSTRGYWKIKNKFWMFKWLVLWRAVSKAAGSWKYAVADRLRSEDR